MSTFGEWRRRLWYRLNRNRAEADLQREMATHRAMMDEPARFGDALRVREATRDVWGWNWADDLGRDLRTAWRGLRRSPTYTLSAVAILGVGIGLNLAFFQIYSGLYLKPLSVRDPATLVRFELLQANGPPRALTYATTELIRANSSNALTTILTEARGRTFWGDDGTDRVSTSFVSAHWFQELGASAELGRTFRADLDQQPDAPAVVVISHRFWEVHFSRDAGILGRVVTINGHPAVIVGVIPQGFHGLDRRAPDVWIPINLMQSFGVGEYGLALEMYGRRHSTASIDLIREQMRGLIAALAIEHPEVFGGNERLEPYESTANFEDASQRADRLQFLVAINGTVLVLLVICANLSNLVLSRVVGRLRELSLRTALGASRWRIVRLLLAENLIVSALGATAAIALTALGLRVLDAFVEIPSADFSIDWRTYVAGMFAGAIAAAAIGLVPALQMRRRDLIGAMKDGGEQTSISLGGSRSRPAMIFTQIVGSCLLLMVAGEMLRARELALISPGYEFEKVAIVDAPLAEMGIESSAAKSYWTNLQQEVVASPSVEGAALVAPTPSGNSRWAAVMNLPDLSGRAVAVKRVDGEFFQVMGIPVLLGRSFNSSDDPRTTVIISQSLGKAIYGTGDPIGRELATTAQTMTIVGIVGDTRHLADLYLPLNSATVGDAGLVVRAKTEAVSLVAPLWNVTRTLSKKIPGPPPEVTTMESATLRAASGDRFVLTLVASSAALTLCLAFLGMVSVISYTTNSRRKEIGIRMTFGASRRSILMLLVRQLTWPVSFGIGIGIAGSVLAARSLAPGQTLDTVVPIVVVALTIGVSAIAATIPVLRVWRWPMLTILRTD